MKISECPCREGNLVDGTTSQKAENLAKQTLPQLAVQMPGSLGSSDSQPFGIVFSGPGYPATMITTPPTPNTDLSPSPLNDSGLSHLQKRTHLQFSLPSEETIPQAAWDPRKKVKTVYPTVGLYTVVWTWIVDVAACRSQQGSHERLKTSNHYAYYSLPGQAITLSPHK